MAVDLLTMGETLVSLAPTGVGRLDATDQFRKSVGGAESNTAIGLARLGRSVTWISRLGVDPFGDEILRRLRGEGVDVHNVEREGSAPTGLMIKELRGPDEVNVYYYRQGSAASRLEPIDVDEGVVSQARRVHVTGITLALGSGPREAVHKLLKVAKQHEVPVSFDPNLRRKLWSSDEALRHIRAILPFVDDLLLSEREALELTGAASWQPALEALAADDFASVVLKRGAEGAVSLHGGQLHQVPAERGVTVVDAVGAGDAFNVGYIHSLLDDDLGHADALRIGNWVASRAVSHWGDYEGLPSAAEYERFLDGREAVRR